MSETPLGIEAEISASPVIKESVTISPKEKTATVDVDTTQKQLADYFQEYADNLGFDGEAAKQFFEEKVVFTFDPKEAFAEYNVPDVSSVDNALSRTLMKLKPPQFLGQVLPRRDGKLSMCVNLKGIADEVSKNKKGGKDPEALQERMNTVTNHELRHVLQFMTQPELVQRKSWQMADNQKLLLGFAMGFAASAAAPETLPYTIGALGALKCFSLIVHGRGIDMERDPLEAQKTDITKLQRRPFNFTASAIPEAGTPLEAESSSPTEASNQYLNSWEGKIDAKLLAISKPAALGSLLLTLGTLTGAHPEATIAAGAMTAGFIWANRLLNREVTSRTNPQPKGNIINGSK